MIKQCLKCGKDFRLKPSKSYRKYCSPECAFGRKPEPRVMRFYVCLWCEKPFETNERHHRGMYCSHACDLAHRKAKFQETATERFWARVDKSGGDSSCWPWLGAKDKGYGKLGFNGKNTSAHRVAYELTYGSILDNLFACHKCDNPSCCNPDHLFLGTNGDNIRDMVSKGRAWLQQPGVAPRGSANPNAKFSPAQVVAIRDAYANKSMTGRGLAKAYGVGVNTISRIIQRKSYKD